MLEIRDFSKTYKGGKRAVDHLTLTVNAGDIYGFISHNGAGKTTTLKAVSGILDYEEGDILVGGVSLKANPVAVKRRIAFVPDNPDLYEHLTGVQYLSFIADVFEVSADDREARISRYADLLTLTPALGDLVSSYSHGMKQKLALIGALCHEPELMLLDEPFVGLDPKAAFTLKELMRGMCAAGCAILFSTHVLDVAEKLCNKIAIIKNGRLIAFGLTDEVRGNKSLEAVFLELTDHE